MAAKKKSRKRKHTRKKKQNRTVSTVVLAVLILLAIVFLGYQMRHFFHNNEESQEQESPLPASQLSSDCFGFNGQFKTYDDGTVTAEIGLDISSHNGWVDWSTVAQNVDFVILRAGYRGYTDGSLNLDEYLEYNLQTASENGLGIGLYFFSQAITPEEAEEEAKMVVNAIAGYNIEYPIYFDWETVSSETARTASISASDLTACAKAFCETVEASGYDAGIYFNLSQAFRLFDLTELKQYDFWLANYSDVPSFPYQISTWQYTNEGTCPGVDTTADLDLYFRENDG